MMVPLVLYFCWCRSLLNWSFEEHWKLWSCCCVPMEPYEPSTGVTTVIVEEFHHKDKYLSTFRLNPGHFFVDSADPSHVNMLANFPSIKNMSEISSKFESKYLRRNSSCSWQRFLGVIHKPWGQIFRHFWLPSPYGQLRTFVQSPNCRMITISLQNFRFTNFFFEFMRNV